MSEPHDRCVLLRLVLIPNQLKQLLRNARKDVFAYGPKCGDGKQLIRTKQKQQSHPIQSHPMSEIGVMKTARCFHHKQTDS